MKLFVSLAFAGLVGYIALILSLNNLSAGSTAVCSQEFTFPAIACRLGAVGVTLLLVPASSVLAFIAARKVLAK